MQIGPFGLNHDLDPSFPDPIFTQQKHFKMGIPRVGNNPNPILVDMSLS